VPSSLLVLTLFASCTLPKDSADPARDAGGADSGFDASFDAERDGAALPISPDAAALYELDDDYEHTCLRGPYTIGPDDMDRRLALPLINDWVCAITSVRGALALETDFVSLDFDESEYANGHAPSWWQLQASPGVAVTAWCAKTLCFSGPDRAVSASGPFREGLDPVRPFEVYGSIPCTPNVANGWDGDTVTYLSELRGNWSRPHQETWIEPPIEVCTDRRTEECPRVQVYLRACAPGSVEVRTHSFLGCNLELHPPARYVGPFGRGHAVESGEFSSDASGAVVLASVHEAMCMLTGVTGPFRDLDDAITLKPMINGRREVSWVLLTSSTFLEGPSARVRCYLYDQDP
jgi:hypothetical protein